MNAQSIQWRCRGCGIAVGLNNAECSSCGTSRPTPDQRRLLLLASIVRPVTDNDVEDVPEVPVRRKKKGMGSLNYLFSDNESDTTPTSSRKKKDCLLNRVGSEGRDFASDEPEIGFGRRMTHAALSTLIGFFSGLLASISFCFFLGGVSKVAWITGNSWMTIFTYTIGIWAASGFIAGFSGHARPFIRLASPAWMSVMLGIAGMFVGSIASIGAPATSPASTNAIGTGCFAGVILGTIIGLLWAMRGSNKDRRFVL